MYVNKGCFCKLSPSINNCKLATSEKHSTYKSVQHKATCSCADANYKDGLHSSPTHGTENELRQLPPKSQLILDKKPVPNSYESAKLHTCENQSEKLQHKSRERRESKSETQFLKYNRKPQLDVNQRSMSADESGNNFTTKKHSFDDIDDNKANDQRRASKATKKNIAEHLDKSGKHNGAGSHYGFMHQCKDDSTDIFRLSEIESMQNITSNVCQLSKNYKSSSESSANTSERTTSEVTARLRYTNVTSDSSNINAEWWQQEGAEAFSSIPSEHSLNCTSSDTAPDRDYKNNYTVHSPTISKENLNEHHGKKDDQNQPVKITEIMSHNNHERYEKSQSPKNFSSDYGRGSSVSISSESSIDRKDFLCQACCRIQQQLIESQNKQNANNGAFFNNKIPTDFSGFIGFILDNEHKIDLAIFANIVNIVETLQCARCQRQTNRLYAFKKFKVPVILCTHNVKTGGASRDEVNIRDHSSKLPNNKEDICTPVKILRLDCNSDSKLEPQQCSVAKLGSDVLSTGVDRRSGNKNGSYSGSGSGSGSGTETLKSSSDERTTKVTLLTHPELFKQPVQYSHSLRAEQTLLPKQQCYHDKPLQQKYSKEKISTTATDDDIDLPQAVSNPTQQQIKSQLLKKYGIDVADIVTAHVINPIVRKMEKACLRSIEKEMQIITELGKLPENIEEAMKIILKK